MLDGNSIGTISYTVDGEEYLNRVDISGAFITITDLNITDNSISGSFGASVSTITSPDALLISSGLLQNITFTEQ